MTTRGAFTAIFIMMKDGQEVWNPVHCQLTWREKDLRAGMGMSAAMKNANMLVNDVRRTLTPDEARQYPACFCTKNRYHRFVLQTQSNKFVCNLVN